MSAAAAAKRPEDEATSARRGVRPGFSLPGYYYRSGERFAGDAAVLAERAWLPAGHISQIPRAGDYFLFDFAAENLILMRAQDGAINAFYNVCRHRGSRVCLEPAGHAKLLVCPYHAWSYNTDGRLVGSRDMTADFDAREYGLKRCHVGIFEGLIFVNLSPAEVPPSFHAFTAPFEPMIKPYLLGRAKVIARDLVECAANWKLVVENFVECYHCPCSHKTYARRHRLDTMLTYTGEAEPAWLERLRAEGLYFEPFADDPSRFHFQAGVRLEIGNGASSGGMDGEPMAPLLGTLRSWSQTWTAHVFNPFCHMACYDDHVVIFAFVPRGPSKTDCIMTWLVRDDAIEGRDYDPAEIAQMWRLTFAEDKTICANNQLGVGSAAYQPGPYSRWEGRASAFVDWYLRHFVDAVAP